MTQSPQSRPSADRNASQRFPRGLAHAFRFLTRARLIACDNNDADWSATLRWIVPTGLLIGLAWTAVFRITWRIYGETANMVLIPALAIILLECILTGRLLLLGATGTVERMAGIDDKNAGANAPLSTIGVLTLCTVVLTQWVLLVSLRDITTWWPSAPDWRHHFNFLYPRIIFRPLILAPLWGRWGILLATTIGRPSSYADTATAGISRAIGPRRMLIHTLLPIIVTTVFFSREQNRFIGGVMSMLVFAVTFFASFAVARRCGGQSRHTIFAAGLVAQLGFLAIYRAFWPLIYQ